MEYCKAVYEVYTPTRQLRMTDELAFRTYTWAQFRRLLDKIPAFEIAGLHDFTYNLDSPIHIGADTRDVVFVLRKR